MTNSSRSSGSDLEPIGHVLGSLIRRSYIVVAAVAVVALGTWLLTGLSEDPVDEITATSRVGITTEAQWPFYDVVLEQGRMMIDRPEFLPQLEAELGFDVQSIRTVIPDKLSVFDIEIVADTPSRAAEAADRAAAMVVEQGVEEANQDRLEQIASLEQGLADLDRRVEAAKAEVQEQGERLAEIAAQQAVEFDTVREEERYSISLQRDVSQLVYTDLERERQTKQSELSNLRAAAVSDPFYQVLRLAETSDSSSAARVPITLAASLAALLVACAVAVVVDRRTGTVRSAWQLRNICGAPATGELARSGAALQTTGALADEIHRALDAGQRVIGLADLSGRRLDLDMVVRQLDAQGLPAALVGSPTVDHGARVGFVDVTDEYAGGDSLRTNSHGCDSILLFVDSRTSVRQTAEAIDRITTSPGLLTAMMVKAR